MPKKQILLLIEMGTPLQRYKMAPLINRIKQEPFFDVSVCNTGQHTNLIKGVFYFFR